VEYISRLRKQAEELEKSLVELAIYSDGSISLNDAWQMSFEERNLAVLIINERNLRKAGKDPNQNL
jgi:hypothetical protein